MKDCMPCISFYIIVTQKLTNNHEYTYGGVFDQDRCVENGIYIYFEAYLLW